MAAAVQVKTNYDISKNGAMVEVEELTNDTSDIIQIMPIDQAKSIGLTERVIQQQ